MTACNKRPPPEHPLHGTGVACHMSDDHDGGCIWALRPSLARRGIDRLLATFPIREIASIDSQGARSIMARDVETGEESEATRLSAGPWVLVRFVGGEEFAIWKATGAVYVVGLDGAVGEDPILEVAGAEDFDDDRR